MLDDTLRTLLTTPIEAFASPAVLERLDAEPARSNEKPIDAAILCGFGADGVSYAFAAGYVAALSALFGPLLPDGDRVASLCVTEAGGGHPRAIATRFHNDADGALCISGEKRWATLAPVASDLLIATKFDDGDGTGPARPRLLVVRVDANSPGVTITPMPSTAFAPEVPHGTVRLDSVLVRHDDVFPGDGYERYIKPFRTVEDCHVQAAILGYLFRVARQQGWPRSYREETLAALVALRALALEYPSAPEIHIALGGALANCRRVVEAAVTHWSADDGEGRARWERDLPLLQIAGNARAQRLERAWGKVGGAPSARHRRDDAVSARVRYGAARMTWRGT